VKVTASRVAPILATGFAVLCAAGQIFATGSSTDGFERIAARFNTTAPPAYRAYRRMEAGIPGSSKQGWMEAWTEFQPGRGFSFEVVSESGHDYVRNKVLRNLLKNEQELLARGQPLRATFNANNYSFGDGGITDDGLQRITLKAARTSDGIVNGSLLVDPDAGSMVRLEGRLVKSPSFWVRDVDVTWKFARLGGHLLPVEMTSAGRVRMFGRSTFRMVYEYVSIEGRPIGNGLKASLRDEQ
jgi:hypothetical protein